MATTTNYGWTTPDDTALVKDGASAIRSLGTSVDTTTKNLNPSTTLGDIEYRSSTANTNTRLGIGSSGQVLTVAGGVPSWATPTTGDIEGVTAGTGISGGGTSGTVTITNSMATAITTAGDLIKGTGSGTFDRLGIGSTGQVLTVSGGAPAWVTATGGVTSASSNVDTVQATSSTSYTDLNTVQSVTLTTGTKAVVFLSAEMQNSAVSNCWASVAISGATTRAADDAYAVRFRPPSANIEYRLGAHRYFSGLTAGSNTFTMQFKATGGNTGTWGYRTITVIDLGS